MKGLKLAILPLVVAVTVAIYVFNNQASVDLAESGQAAAAATAGPLPPLKTRPNFTQITDVNVKKTTFFEYMLPMIRRANAKILTERNTISRIRGSFAEHRMLTASDRQALLPLLEKYNIDTGEDQDNDITVSHLTELLTRCDIVPAALILAQSANESAWGTSRFATKGNNFFGLWCFSPGCGLKPSQRNEGANHEVAKFESVNSGVEYYVQTINTHFAYEQLRLIRAELRADNEKITGTVLAEGLLRYSERGQAYVDEIKHMIRYNKLSRYNIDTRA
jgi:Bax protein